MLFVICAYGTTRDLSFQKSSSREGQGFSRQILKGSEVLEMFVPSGRWHQLFSWSDIPIALGRLAELAS